MVKIKSLIFFIALMIGESLVAQQVIDTEIRNVESQELNALLKGDTVALFTKYWSPKMVVNTPANVVGDIENTKKNLRAGRLNYSSMTRNIERITIIENIAIVMGNEILKPQGTNENAGKTVTRRFTNIWMKSMDGWRIVARQSTIISVK